MGVREIVDVAEGTAETSTWSIGFRRCEGILTEYSAEFGDPEKSYVVHKFAPPLAQQDPTPPDVTLAATWRYSDRQTFVEALLQEPLTTCRRIDLTFIDGWGDTYTVQTVMSGQGKILRILAPQAVED
jgi:hypothetical protein